MQVTWWELRTVNVDDTEIKAEVERTGYPTVFIAQEFALGSLPKDVRRILTKDFTYDKDIEETAPSRPVKRRKGIGSY